MAERPEVVRVTPVDDTAQVVTVRGGGWRFCRRPCDECPWRRKNDGSFPAGAFLASAETSWDQATTTFACHMAGADHPATCAGFLLSSGAEHNLRVRLAILDGHFAWNLVEAAGADLHPDYPSMAEANGVPADHPRLRPCR